MEITVKDIEKWASTPNSKAHGYGSTNTSPIIDVAIVRAATSLQMKPEILEWYLESPHSIDAMDNLAKTFKGGFTKEFGATHMLAFWRHALGVAKDLYRAEHPSL